MQTIERIYDLKLRYGGGPYPSSMARTRMARSRPSVASGHSAPSASNSTSTSAPGGSNCAHSESPGWVKVWAASVDPATRAVRESGNGRFGGTVTFRLILWAPGATDRKSTRLNSSHLGISYAVF